MPAWLYRGTVRHERLQPRRYGFQTDLFMFYLDLDDLEGLVRSNRWISRNRFNLYSFYDRDHFYLGQAGIRQNLNAYLQREGVREIPARVHLLTHLRFLGYVFNPVSFYFCFREDGSPLCVVAEVQNTYGELKPYLLAPEDWDGQRFHREHAKEFYISPFSPLDPLLILNLKLPDEGLSLTVDSRHREEPKPFFHASFRGQRRPLNSRSLWAHSLRFPFVTVKVIALIHWHALRLYLLGVPVHRKQDRPELQKGLLPKARPSKP